MTWWPYLQREIAREFARLAPSPWERFEPLRLSRAAIYGRRAAVPAYVFAGPGQCAASTYTGKRCWHKANAGARFCGRHRHGTHR